MTEWTFTSQSQLVLLQHKLGNQWAKMTAIFKDRSSNNLKNQFFSIVRRCIRKCCRVINEHHHLPRITNLKSTTLSQFFAIFCECVREKRGCVQPENHIKNLMELAFLKNYSKNDNELISLKEILRKTINKMFNFE